MVFAGAELTAMMPECCYAVARVFRMVAKWLFTGKAISHGSCTENKGKV